MYYALSGGDGGILVPAPHARTEVGQLVRVAELDALPEFRTQGGFAMAAFGGPGRVSELQALLEDLRGAGVDCVVCSRGLVGPIRRCLDKVSLLGYFSQVYANIGGANPTDFDRRAQRAGPGSEARYMGSAANSGWGSKAHLVARCLREKGLRGDDAIFVDDTPAEIANVRGTCATIQVDPPHGMGERELALLRRLLPAGRPGGAAGPSSPSSSSSQPSAPAALGTAAPRGEASRVLPRRRSAPPASAPPSDVTAASEAAGWCGPPRGPSWSGASALHGEVGSSSPPPKAPVAGAGRTSAPDAAGAASQSASQPSRAPGRARPGPFADRAREPPMAAAPPRLGDPQDEGKRVEDSETGLPLPPPPPAGRRPPAVRRTPDAASPGPLGMQGGVLASQDTSPVSLDRGGLSPQSPPSNRTRSAPPAQVDDRLVAAGGAASQTRIPPRARPGGGPDLDPAAVPVCCWIQKGPGSRGPGKSDGGDPRASCSFQ